MEQQNNEDKRQRFHVVQLAMFNADVLSGVEREASGNSDGICRQIIDQSAQRNVASAPPAPSATNQSLFFGMAYLSLVWLRESLSNDEVDKALASKKMSGVWDRAQAKGPRDISASKQKLRLVRNALSHGNVSIDENFVFSFWDRNPRDNRETRDTVLSMTYIDLGNLVNKFYSAVSDVIYT